MCGTIIPHNRVVDFLTFFIKRKLQLRYIFYIFAPASTIFELSSKMWYILSILCPMARTLLCVIIVLHILLIFDFFPCLHALLGTACLLILMKSSYLHVYLELKTNGFRENLSISLDIWLQLDPLTCLIHFCIQLLQYLTF